MNLDTVEQLILLVEQSSITNLEIEEKELTIRISKAGSTGGATVCTNSSSASSGSRETTGSRINPKKLFRSPMIGSFHRTSGEEDSPLVSVGDQVKQGQPLCIIEAMKMLNMVESDRDGTIEKILVESGHAVEFGQPLFVIAD